MKFVDLFFPPRCPICHKILPPCSTHICPDCTAKLPIIREPRCKICGKEVTQGTHICYDCQRNKHVFTRGIGIYTYDNLMKQSILRYKYGGKKEYAAFYTISCLVYAEAYLREWDPALIVPVPSHRSRRRKRGFNQAALIAESMGKYLHIPVDEGAVIRSSRTRALWSMNPTERRRALRDAFESGGRDLGKRTILIVDDIYTTGATMDAVARELKRQNAGQIYFLTVCIGKSFMVK